MVAMQNILERGIIHTSSASITWTELPMQSPLLHSILRTLDQWLASLVNHIENKKGPPPEYIPGCFAESQVTGPAILKYRGLLETHNTPFAYVVLPMVFCFTSLYRWREWFDNDCRISFLLNIFRFSISKKFARVVFSSIYVDILYTT